VVGYLPGLLTGILIIMGGLLLGNLAKSAIMTAFLRAGLQQSTAMARSAQVIIVFSAIIIGVEQIGLDVNFLSSLIVVVVGILFAGAALAFGLGAKTLVANLLGAQYSRKHCRLGELLRIGDIEGEVVEITQLSIVLDTGTGRAVIPAKMFNELISVHGTSRESGQDGPRQ
jgi:small-conductance mechanosensitive channel